MAEQQQQTPQGPPQMLSPPQPQEPSQPRGWEGQQDGRRNYQDYPVEEDVPPQISADLSDIARSVCVW